MKKFWKALGIAALAAAVPVRCKKDETTGRKKYQSLLLSVDVAPNEDGQGTSIGVNIGEGLLTDAISSLTGSKKESVHFADDDPEAAVVPDVIDFTQAAAEQAQASADKAQAAADEAQAAADEANAAAEDAQAVQEADEEDFDPEM